MKLIAKRQIKIGRVWLNPGDWIDGNCFDSIEQKENGDIEIKVNDIEMILTPDDVSVPMEY